MAWPGRRNSAELCGTLWNPPPPHPPTPPQPHLDRTRLCELGDEAFEKAYLEKRDALKQLIRALARPKARRDGVGPAGRGGKAAAPALRLDRLGCAHAPLP